MVDTGRANFDARPIRTEVTRFAADPFADVIGVIVSASVRVTRNPAGATDRIVCCGPGAVDRDLKFHLSAIGRPQQLANAASEQRRVRQHDQLAAVRLRDVPGEITNVAPEEWLAAGDVDAFNAKRGGGIDRRDSVLSEHSRNSVRPGRGEAMRTRA
ncbi:MAG TPA: hypothetical protein VF962_13995 [Gemmatimonadaceae bacterium]